jgi:hypothetical protein
VNYENTHSTGMQFYALDTGLLIDMYIMILMLNLYIIAVVLLQLSGPSLHYSFTFDRQSCGIWCLWIMVLNKSTK